MSRDDRLRIWHEENLVPQLHLMLLAPDAAAVASNLGEVLATPNPNSYTMELGLGRFLYYRDVHNIPSWVIQSLDLCGRIWGIDRLRPWVRRLYAEMFGAIPFDESYSYAALEVWGLCARFDDSRLSFGILDSVLEKADWTRVSAAARARFEAPVFIDDAQFQAWKATNLK